MYRCVVATVETIFSFFPFLLYVGVDPFYLGRNWPFVQFSIPVNRTSAFFLDSAVIDVHDLFASSVLPLNTSQMFALVVDPLRILPLQSYSDIPTFGSFRDLYLFHSSESDPAHGDIQHCDSH